MNAFAKNEEPNKKDSEDIGKPKDKQKMFKIQGNVLVLHGNEKSDIQLTTDEKNAFIESVDEFRTNVAELVEFDKMNVFPENVEWKGKILELNLNFFYTINEPHGIYLNGDMVKIDEEYLEIVGKLQSNYEKFNSLPHRLRVDIVQVRGFFVKKSSTSGVCGSTQAFNFFV